MKRLIAKQCRIRARLSSRDWSWLLALIEAPTRPNEKLQAALNRRKP